MTSAASSNPEEYQDSLVGHLTELRRRLIYSLVAAVVAAIACWNFSEQIFDIIRRPIQPFLKAGGGGSLIFTAPMDKFLAHIKVSLLSGVIISCPVWIYQLWCFVAPGLYKTEKRYGAAFIFSGSCLFLTGVSFVYFVVYPLAFEFLMNFGGPDDIPMITISEYLSFFITTTLVFGAAFELPLVLTLLGIAGIIDQEFLRSKRRYAIVMLAVLSAMVTPPDALSMVMMILPMVLLYEISVILVGIFGQKQN